MKNNFFKEPKKKQKKDELDLEKLAKTGLILAGGIVLLGAGVKVLGDL